MKMLSMLCFVPLLALAQDPRPAVAVRELKAAFEKAREEFSAAYAAAKTEEEKQRVLAEKYPRAEDWAPRFLAIAEEHPDDPAAVEALVWVVSSSRARSQERALDLLLARHVRAPGLEQACLSLRYSYSGKAAAFLERVLDESPFPTTQGAACYALARILLRDAATRERAERLLERAVEEFTDVPLWRDRTIADAARADLFELRNLVPGKEAPEITGEDVEGRAMKLSDFRGQVVVLDFWGFW